MDWADEDSYEIHSEIHVHLSCWTRRALCVLPGVSLEKLKVL